MTGLLMNESILMNERPQGADNGRNRILWVSPLEYMNSFAQVSEMVLRPFIKKYGEIYDIYIYRIGISSDPSIKEILNQKYNIPLENIFYIPKIRNLGFKPEDKLWWKNYIMGGYTLSKIIAKVDPDVVISLNDTEPLKQQWLSICSARNYELKGWKGQFVPYIAIDMDPSMRDFSLFLFRENKHVRNTEKTNKVKFALTMSTYGKEILRKYCDLSHIYILPHIIKQRKNEALFVDKDALRKKWFDDPEFKAHCVIGSVNCNHVRKRFDILISAFNLLQQKYPNKVFYLLIKTSPSDKYDPYVNYDFSKIQHKNIKIIQQNLSEQELDEVYDCMDLFVSTTSGEGFGMTPCEALLRNIPVVVPDNTAYKYLLNAYQGLVPTKPETGMKSRAIQNLNVTFENKFLCIFKSYVTNRTTKIEERDVMYISKLNPTLIVSQGGDDDQTFFNQLRNNKPITISNKLKFENLNLEVIGHVNGLRAFFNGGYAELDKKYDFYQVLINENATFLNNMLQQCGLFSHITCDRAGKFIFSKFVELEKSYVTPNRLVYVLNFNHLINYTSKQGVAPICYPPDPADVLQKMEEMLFRPHTKIQNDMLQYKSILSKFDEKKIIDTLHFILQNISDMM